MTVLRASDAPIGLNEGKPVRASASLLSWSRPTDWVTFTTPAANEQKVIGTVAVYNQDSNYIALSTTVSTGTYTVNWGDGTSANFTSGTTAEKNYTWGSISSGTLSSRGYRQAVITITPTTGGATFSTVDLNKRHSAIPSGAANVTSPWLDIAVAAPNATTIVFQTPSGGSSSIHMPLCEQINIVAHNLTNMRDIFNGIRELQSVNISSTSAVTSMQSLFASCRSLKTVPLLDTAAVTNMNGMFSNCFSLESVPLFNTAAVTDMSNMFSNCRMLKSVPLFNTAAVTLMNNMFLLCSRLKTVPLFNTAAVTNMSGMLSNCTALESVPLFNTAAVTNISSMFSTCVALKNVPLFNTAAVTNMTSMFRDCLGLESVPLFNTANVTTMSAMLQNCPILESVPLFNTAAVTNMNGMLQSCSSLQTVPLFNTAAVTDMTSMLLLAGPGLQNIPELNLYAIADAGRNALGLGSGGVSSATTSLSQAKLTGNRWTQTFQNCRLGATQLNEMYTALAVLNPAVTNATGNGTTVTYTIADRRAFVSGRTVTMTGITPVAYNLTNATVVTVTATTGNAGTFTVTNAATGTFVSGGIATLQDNKTITVTNNPGTATDDPTIATNKGWTVTG